MNDPVGKRFDSWNLTVLEFLIRIRSKPFPAESFEVRLCPFVPLSIGEIRRDRDLSNFSLAGKMTTLSNDSRI